MSSAPTSSGQGIRIGSPHLPCRTHFLLPGRGTEEHKACCPDRIEHMCGHWSERNRRRGKRPEYLRIQLSASCTVVACSTEIPSESNFPRKVLRVIPRMRAVWD